jgi:hypothetical protein
MTMKTLTRSQFEAADYNELLALSAKNWQELPKASFVETRDMTNITLFDYLKIADQFPVAYALESDGFGGHEGTAFIAIPGTTEQTVSAAIRAWHKV